MENFGKFWKILENFGKFSKFGKIFKILENFFKKIFILTNFSILDTLNVYWKITSSTNRSCSNKKMSGHRRRNATQRRQLIAIDSPVVVANYQKSDMVRRIFFDIFNIFKYFRILEYFRIFSNIFKHSKIFKYFLF